MCNGNVLEKQGKEEIAMKKININPEVESAFYNACKRGIYKELERKKLITPTQLNQLLKELYKT